MMVSIMDLERYYRCGWRKFPSSLPLDGRTVELATVDLDGSIFIFAKGVGTEEKSSGPSISINGNLVSRNLSILWRYTESVYTGELGDIVLTSVAM